MEVATRAGQFTDRCGDDRRDLPALPGIDMDGGRQKKKWSQPGGNTDAHMRLPARKEQFLERLASTIGERIGSKEHQQVTWRSGLQRLSAAARAGGRLPWQQS